MDGQEMHKSLVLKILKKATWKINPENVRCIPNEKVEKMKEALKLVKPNMFGKWNYR